ncbi:UNVERIFIED_CONTAM: hypothetical protein K2H54_007618 [Gekko kuhli]
MTFAEFLQQVGGMGRFQFIHTMLLIIPVLLMASHNLLQNFTAAIPGHRCRVHVAANGSGHPNATHLLEASDLLKVGIPVDSNQQLEKCRRFVDTQWQLLNPNSTEANKTEMTTEPCADGWVYDRTLYSSTIIIEPYQALSATDKA